MFDSGYAITFNGQFDTRSFGLYRTLVGLDTTNNMMENVTPYKEQAATKTDEPIDVEFGVDQKILPIMPQTPSLISNNR